MNAERDRAVQGSVMAISGSQLPEKSASPARQAIDGLFFRLENGLIIRGSDDPPDCCGMRGTGIGHEKNTLVTNSTTNVGPWYT